MIDNNESYEIDELKEILNYYVCNNGAILGKIFFKAHLNDQKRILPKEINDVDDFIENYLCQENSKNTIIYKNYNVYDSIVEIKKDLLMLKSIKTKKEIYSKFNKFIDKWLNKLKLIE